MPIQTYEGPAEVVFEDGTKYTGTGTLSYSIGFGWSGSKMPTTQNTISADFEKGVKIWGIDYWPEWMPDGMPEHEVEYVKTRIKRVRQKVGAKAVWKLKELYVKASSDDQRRSIQEEIEKIQNAMVDDLDL